MKCEQNWKTRLLALSCLTAAVTPCWARLPPPVQVAGVVVQVDRHTHTLVFKPESSQKVLVLDWNPRTQFARGGMPVSPGDLLPGSRIAVSYKPVSFHHPLLKRVLLQPEAPRIAVGR